MSKYRIRKFTFPYQNTCYYVAEINISPAWVIGSRWLRLNESEGLCDTLEKAEELIQDYIDRGKRNEMFVEIVKEY